MLVMDNNSIRQDGTLWTGKFLKELSVVLIVKKWNVWKFQSITVKPGQA